MSNPRLITQRDLILGVAEKWRGQYADAIRALNKDPDSLTGHQLKNAKVYAKLLKLKGDTATAGDVAAIIGNDSWTEIHCDQCEKSVLAAVVVGADMDYDSATAMLCVDCLEQAASLLRNP